MRVLIIGLNYAPEPIGIGPYTTGMAEWLAAAGHEVHVVAGKPYYPQWRRYPGWDAPGWHRSVENGVGIVRCPHYVPARPTGLKRIVHHASFAAAALFPALSRARRIRPDAVICIAPSIMSAFPARAAAALAGAPLWLHLQDFETDAAFATGMVRGKRLAGVLLAAERAVLRAAAMVSTISPAMVARLVEKGVPRERTCEVRNWANATAPEPAPQPLRETLGLEGKRVALYSGSIGRKQGAGLIVDAAERLAARDDLVFLICGEGPERAALERRAATLPNVRFAPLQPAGRLAELLALATVHLLPQVPEAADLVLPSKLTNMLGSGRPVIATAQPGTGLADEIEGCGIVVAPGDSAALAAAIAALLDDPRRTDALGKAALERARERWSRDAILGAFEARLEAIVGQSKRR